MHVVASAGKRWTEIGKCSVLQKCIEIALVRIIVFWNFIASYASYASIIKKLILNVSKPCKTVADVGDGMMRERKGVEREWATEQASEQLESDGADDTKLA